MTNNLFETQYDLTKKSKLREFYESNKIWIFSTIFAFIITLTSSLSLLIKSQLNKAYFAKPQQILRVVQ